MKSSNAWVPIAAMILTAALAGPAAAQTQVPFSGTLQGTDTDGPMPTPTSIQVTTNGTGISTLLGQFTFVQDTTVNFVNSTDAGSARWWAANGDSIDTTLSGSGEPTTAPGVIRITEVHVITGGTGRFAAAQGSFTVDRLASVVTFQTSGSFHGTVTAPGPAR